jgi:TM2 domain-containing membrane protein YozV
MNDAGARESCAGRSFYGNKKNGTVNMTEIGETPAKSPYKAAFYCLILGPGAGQIYNGQKRKGAAMMILFLAPVCYLTYMIFAIYSKYWQRAMEGDLSVAGDFIREVRSSESISTNSSFAAVLWIISMVDGFVSANLINKQNARLAAGDNIKPIDGGDTNKTDSEKI